jgi:hypothetical protein
MSVTDAVLLGVSVVLFCYIGLALFKPEWF